MQLDLVALLKAHPEMTLFLIIGIGYLIGKIGGWGIQLGSSIGVLFIALLFGCSSFESILYFWGVHALIGGFTENHGSPVVFLGGFERVLRLSPHRSFFEIDSAWLRRREVRLQQRPQTINRGKNKSERIKYMYGRVRSDS